MGQLNTISGQLDRKYDISLDQSQTVSLSTSDILNSLDGVKTRLSEDGYNLNLVYLNANRPTTYSKLSIDFF